MTKNVGKKDQYLRISGGFCLLGCGIIRKSPLLVSLGSMAIAEGITRWCPTYSLLNKSTVTDAEKLEDMGFTYDY